MARIGVVVFEGFQSMGLAALTAFEIANAVLQRPAYQVVLLSETGGPVTGSLGFAVSTEPFGAAPDTLVTIGTIAAVPAPPGVTAWLREAAPAARRVAGICTGAFALAEAGLLDGRHATTHWAHAGRMRRRFPAVIVEPDRIFAVDGRIWTSAGMSAGIDLALALVEEDFGTPVARAVAQGMVVYLRRPGGQSQFSALLDLEPKSDRVRSALRHAREHLANPLSVEELAEAARLSPRQFSRVFRAETGQSPARAVEHLRLEAARTLMEEGRHSLDEIARETGFADRDRMRRAFLRAFGQPPQVMRRIADAGRPGVG